MKAQRYRAGDSVRYGGDVARSEQHNGSRVQMRFGGHEQWDGPHQGGQVCCLRLTTDGQAYGEERLEQKVVGAVDAQNTAGQLDADDIRNVLKIEFDALREG